MTRPLLFVVFILFPLLVAAEQAPKPALEAEIAKIDAVTANPDQKMIAVELMAQRLGTHRNHLLLLRRQTGKSFGHIFVSQLEAAGRNQEEILAGVRALNRRLQRSLSQRGLAGNQGAGSPAPRPIVYLGTGIDHNSAGTFYTLAPEVGVDSRYLTLVAGVPYYKNSGTNLSADGIGDVYTSGFLHGRAGQYDLGANLVVGFPTGDESQGLGAGKVTVDASGVLQRKFKRVRPFLKAGVANSIFNNVGYQRPYIATGNAAHVSGGMDFRVHRRLIIGAGGFVVRPWGTQTVHSRMGMQMSGIGGAGSMPGNQRPGSGMLGMGTPGFGGGMSGGIISATPSSARHMPFLTSAPGSNVPAEELRDHGAVAWASFMIRPGISLNFSVARSIPFELTTVGFGLSFDFARLLFPGKRF